MKLTLSTAFFALALASPPGRAHADTAVADGKPITAGSPYVLDAQACLESVAEARAAASDVVGAGQRWVHSAVTCEVAADDGCGSAMTDHELQFLTGGPHCAHAARIPAYVYHEWAHGLNHSYGIQAQALDEAMADVFAVYLTGNPRFGEGMYLDRDHSWQRDLSDRKIYDGDTKQLYTQSLTLSGAWWEGRERLIQALGLQRAQTLAWKLFLEHLRVMGRHSALGARPTLTGDFAPLLEAAGQITMDAREARVLACAFANAFEDHGFTTGYADVTSGCAREPRPSPADTWLGRFEAPGANPFAGRMISQLPAAIPDPGALTLSFRVAAPVGARVAAVRLRWKTRHDYADDLLVRATAPDGKTFKDLWKGEEELAIPDAMTDEGRLAGALARGTWSIEIIDLAQGESGRVESTAFDVLTNE